METKMQKKLELKPKDLRLVCDPKLFDFKNTSEIAPLDGVIGQERAVQAIDFGLNMKSKGYNIFITGLEGTGKSTIAEAIVRAYAKSLPAPDDWCMVNNFKDEYCPKAVAVPSGNAILFSKMMNRAIEELKEELPKSFEAEVFQKRKTKIKDKHALLQQEYFSNVQQMAARKNVQIERTEAGFETIPLLDGKPISRKAYQAFTPEERKKIEEGLRNIQGEVEVMARDINKINQSLRRDIEGLLDEISLNVIKNQLDPIRSKYKNCQAILEYLDEVQTEMLENVQDFMPTEGKGGNSEAFLLRSSGSVLQKYQVNVMVDHAGMKGAPVIFESNPTYNNVIGQIEKRTYMGSVTTDFTKVKAGSLLKANGGYLIMEVEPLLTHSFVWDALKRALQKRCLAIEDTAAELGFGTASLRPEPIPLEVKVILIGSYSPFRMLQNYDLKFNKIFKVRADFDYEVERSDDTVYQYAQFVARVCGQENLLHFTAKGVATVVEYAEKYVANKNKLSIRFGPLGAVLKEADYWANKRNARFVTDSDVVRAFKEHKFRYNLYEKKMHESLIDETIMIDIKEDIVGQVNALAVYQIGDTSFGRPSRITAETYMGKTGIINIEREAKLSGKTHDKGVLILSGYLGRTFAQNYPLSLAISITFEQSYGGIDGDSASSTELYAIISSLSDVPIHQGIAVTGSVNQKGKIQAIGGVNHKIEGFYDVCKEKGLTGRQGVMIPVSNVKNLMLKREVVTAVKKKQFHIYRVSTVEEGIEILTDLPAGKPDGEGVYPEGTVFGKAQEKLRKYLKRAVQYKKEFEDKKDEPGDKGKQG